MNRIYSLVWNRALRVLQVTSEVARPRGGGMTATGGAQARRRPLMAACVAALAVGGFASTAWSADATCPSAATVISATGTTGAAGAVQVPYIPNGNPTAYGGAGGTGYDVPGQPVSCITAGAAVAGGTGGHGGSVRFKAGTGYNGRYGDSGWRAGAGGTGLTGSGFTLANLGTLAGGAGGAVLDGGTGENGRTGVHGGYGGNGGSGGYGGAGGVAVAADAFTLHNYGTLHGGNGVTGGNGGTGGAGGDGIYAGSGGYGGIGGRGGNGGMAVSGNAFVLINDGMVSGGSGGDGGMGGRGGAAGYSQHGYFPGRSDFGRRGGHGGYGATAISGTDFTLVNDGTVSGGAGGASGYNVDGNYGYYGGGGGAGVSGSGFKLSNSGAIHGGNGGAGHYNSNHVGGNLGAGVAGIGVVSTGGSTITNSGSVTGGVSLGGAGAQLDAIALSGGGNTLTLENGYSFTGDVDSTSGTKNGGDTLALGGDASGNGATGDGTFDLSAIVGTAPAAWDGTVRYSGFNQFAKNGNSTWTVTGNTTVAGNWSVQAGTLVVGDGVTATSLAGGATVGSGAMLGGHGTLSGDVTVQSGGIMAPGSSTTPGTSGAFGALTVGSLVLANGSIVEVNLGAPGVGSGSYGSGDYINDLGDLTLGGSTLHVYNAGGMGPGLYRIISYAGTLTTSGCTLSAGDCFTLGAVPIGQFLTVDTGTPGQINVLDSNASANPFNTWAPTSSAAPGGTGVWNAAAAHWTDASGDPQQAWAPDGFAIFKGTPGTVTIDDGAGAVSATGVQFFVDGYALAGDPLTLIATTANGAISAPVIRVGDGTSDGASMSATISAALAGSGGLDKKDFGKLVPRV